MPIMLKAKSTTDNGYHGFKLIQKGLYANSYSAITPANETVFFKQFGSPSVLVDWQPGFKQYQAEIKGRIEDSRAKIFCYKWLDQFVAKPLKKDGKTPFLVPDEKTGEEIPLEEFYQTYEFLDAGSDMEKELEKAREGDMSFVDRLISAKVMMNAIAALHEAGVVHADLKPDNLMLMVNDNEDVDANYDLKLIDLDFSLQVDKQAPWHNKPGMGYPGTPNWFSPEHKRGEVPVQASDVFTCGLILCELLGGRQPMYEVEETEYLAFIDAESIPSPQLLGKMEELETPGNTQMVEDIICQCLNPDPGKRPTATEVNAALNYEDGDAPPPPPPPIKGKLLLINEASGEQLIFGVETKVGKHLIRPLGEEYRFWHSSQFILNKDSKGCWQIVPDNNAPNDTLHNEKKITEPVRLGLDDQLAVGREESGIVKLPLTCRKG